MPQRLPTGFEQTTPPQEEQLPKHLWLTVLARPVFILIPACIIFFGSRPLSDGWPLFWGSMLNEFVGGDPWLYPRYIGAVPTAWAFAVPVSIGLISGAGCLTLRSDRAPNGLRSAWTFTATLAMTILLMGMSVFSIPGYLAAPILPVLPFVAVASSLCCVGSLAQLLTAGARPTVERILNALTLILWWLAGMVGDAWLDRALSWAT